MKILDARQDLDLEWLSNIIGTVNTKVEVLGYACNFIMNDNLIGRLRNKNISCSFIFSDIKTSEVYRRSLEESDSINAIASRVIDSIDYLTETLNKDNIRLTTQPIYASIYRFDDDMIITPVIGYTDGDAFPVIILNNNAPDDVDLFETYEYMFREYYKHSTLV